MPIHGLCIRDYGGQRVTSVTSYTRRTLPNELADYEAWATFDATCLSTEDRALYDRRMHALRAYLDGTPTETIEHTYGIQSGEVLRYLNRCVAVMGDGRMAGWAGLIKGFRTKAPIRRSPVSTRPMSGCTSSLLATLRQCGSRPPGVAILCSKERQEQYF